MIKYKIKYQGAIFIDSIEFEPSPKNIASLLNEFEETDFLPNTFNEINSSGRFQRIGLRTPSNEWDIRIGLRRIDIEKNPTDWEGTNLGTTQSFCNSVIGYSNKILKLIEKKSNRVALSSNYILDNMSNERLVQINKKLFNLPQTYSQAPPNEWNYRQSSIIEKSFNSTKEEMNMISEINRIQGKIEREGKAKELDNIQIKLDLNTHQKNKKARFDHSAIKKFFTEVPKWENELKNELLEFITK